MKSGLVQKGIRLEDGGYGNPGFDKTKECIPAFSGAGLADISGGASAAPVTVNNHFEINGANLDPK